MVKKLKFGFPTGAIKNHTIELFQRAGYKIGFNEKFQQISLDDDELDCLATRPIEIAPFVEQGFLDAGIATEAALAETKAKVETVCNLGYEMSIWQRAQVLLAVQDRSKIKKLADLKGKTIVTRIPSITKAFLAKNKISAKVVFSDMLVNESKVGLSADATVEIYNRGTTLAAYNLRPIAKIMDSGAVLIASKKALSNKWKKEKIAEIRYALEGARIAQEYSGVMFHASNNMMEDVLKILPSMKKPTVTHLRGQNWFDVFTVAKKKEIRGLIPNLKRIGCTDIVEFSLTKVVP